MVWTLWTISLTIKIKRCRRWCERCYSLILRTIFRTIFIVIFIVIVLCVNGPLVSKIPSYQVILLKLMMLWNGKWTGVAVDSVPLGMSVSLYATILQFLRSCLFTIRTIRTSMCKKHNWMYGKSNGSKYRLKSKT